MVAVVITTTAMADTEVDIANHVRFTIRAVITVANKVHGDTILHLSSLSTTTHLTIIKTATSANKTYKKAHRCLKDPETLFA